jgi:predicted enzyme related to lactoylglutathione lyase
MNIKYVHTNIISSNWKKLAEFYINVFNCKEIPPERELSGSWLDNGTGVKNARLKGIHLLLPGYGNDGPTLEIFEYNQILDRETPKANRKGLGHIAFHVDDIQAIVDMVINKGGKQVGEIVQTIINNRILSFVYLTDPEGNIIEVQRWD